MTRIALTLLLSLAAAGPALSPTGESSPSASGYGATPQRSEQAPQSPQFVPARVTLSQQPQSQLL
jgi:hypothetical protein